MKKSLLQYADLIIGSTTKDEIALQLAKGVKRYFADVDHLEWLEELTAVRRQKMAEEMTPPKLMSETVN